MSALLLRVAVLTAVYLLVLTSVHPADILTGVVLSTLLVAAGRRIRSLGPAPPVPLRRRLAGVPTLVAGTVGGMVRGSWRTARWCLRRRPDSSGLVTVPIPRCGPSSAAAWAVRVGLAADSLVVVLDEERGEMLLHVLDASDPDAVRSAERATYQRHQRQTFP